SRAISRSNGPWKFCCAGTKAGFTGNAIRHSLCCSRPTHPPKQGKARRMPVEWAWMRTGIPPKCKLTKWRKESLKARADEFVNDFYEPTFVKPPPKDPRFNYVVDF